MGLRHEELMIAANREMEIADHLLFVTYPMVKDSKFLLSVASKISTAARISLQALLEFEKHHTNIIDYSPNFSAQLNLYKRELEHKHKLDPTFHRLLQRLFEIYQSNKNSVVKFKRGDSYVLATKDYTLSVLDHETVKKYANVTKKFIRRVDDIIKVPNVQTK